jgi:hypothetical protein
VCVKENGDKELKRKITIRNIGNEEMLLNLLASSRDRYQ